jgi:hypothetical protein
MAMASSSLIAGTVLVEGAGTFTASDARVFGEVRAATMDTRMASARCQHDRLPALRDPAKRTHGGLVQTTTVACETKDVTPGRVGLPFCDFPQQPRQLRACADVVFGGLTGVVVDRGDGLARRHVGRPRA